MMTATETREDGSRGSLITLSKSDFSRLRNFIYDHCGIRITDTKKIMLEARLQKRLRSLGLDSFSQYCTYLFSSDGMAEELNHMVDRVTTNKTDFFREPLHFDYLTRKVLPEVFRVNRTVTVWSAGCSSGEEPYTLAMVIKEFIGDDCAIDFRVVGTDISTRVLETAKLAIYDGERLAPVPPEIQRKYFMRSRDRTKGLYRVTPELRARVTFRRLNFMDDDFGFREEVSVIFCRNVIIYFDKPIQQRLLNRFCRCLKPNGYVFVGHSETLLGMDVPLVQVAPTIYRKKGG
ncbi:MAG: protein-glutamate O-methyltransferase [Syntrophorhabdales bacterium]|jgi:chemotaxis protein methyltransferase CheR